jgi:hypothetical protein
MYFVSLSNEDVDFQLKNMDIIILDDIHNVDDTLLHLCDVVVASRNNYSEFTEFV